MFFGQMTVEKASAMSCDEVVAKYKQLVEASKTRSSKEHRDAAAKAAMILKPFYDRCKIELAVAPGAEQAREIQAITEQIYGVPGAADQFTQGAGSRGLGLDYKKMLLIGAMGALGLFLFLRITK